MIRCKGLAGACKREQGHAGCCSTDDADNSNRHLRIERSACESCDRRGLWVVRFNAKGIGLPFAACLACLGYAIVLHAARRIEG